MKLQNIHPLSEFQRNAKAHIARLKRTGEPSILTVNGQAEVVVLSAAAYQKLLDDYEMLDNMNILHKGLLAAERGEGMPVKEAFALIRKRAAERHKK